MFLLQTTTATTGARKNESLCNQRELFSGLGCVIVKSGGNKNPFNRCATVWAIQEATAATAKTFSCLDGELMSSVLWWACWLVLSILSKHSLFIFMEYVWWVFLCSILSCESILWPEVGQSPPLNVAIPTIQFIHIYKHVRTLLSDSETVLFLQTLSCLLRVNIN